MKVKMFMQIVEVGHWEPNGFDGNYWVEDKVIKDADEINLYLKESCKNDVKYACGTFYSPRLKCFCFKYEFVGINEFSC